MVLQGEKGKGYFSQILEIFSFYVRNTSANTLIKCVFAKDIYIEYSSIITFKYRTNTFIFWVQIRFTLSIVGLGQVAG